MDSLKLISLNIEFNKHLDEIIPFFQKENADILLLQEVMEENLELISKNLNMNYLFTPMTDTNFSWGIKRMGLATFYKQVKKTPTLVGDELTQRARRASFSTSILACGSLEDTTALAVELHKDGIVNIEISYYSGNSHIIPLCDQTEPEKANRAILTTWVKRGLIEFCLVNTHFTWSPGGQPNFRQREDLKKLFKLLSPLKEFILAGDFNAPRGREIFDELASVYKDNIPKNVTTTIDKNLHVAGDLQLVIDGLFTTPKYQVKDIRLVSGVSDHLAIVADISGNIDNK